MSSATTIHVCLCAKPQPLLRIPRLGPSHDFVVDVVSGHIAIGCFPRHTRIVSGLLREGCMIVSINDETVEVADQTTVAALLKSLGMPDKGIAVAVNLGGDSALGLAHSSQSRSAGASGHGGARWLIPS
jgi:hypothetical protein